MEFIDLKEQYRRYKAAIDEGVLRVLAHGQFIQGPEVSELETGLAGYTGVKHCITVANGTASLEIALRALEIGPGDEVITVPYTWISSAEVIAVVGARPVFVDIEPSTYNINIDAIKAAITPKTKAIMPVSLFGRITIGSMPSRRRAICPSSRMARKVLEPLNAAGAVAGSRRLAARVFSRPSHWDATAREGRFSPTTMAWPKE